MITKTSLDAYLEAIPQLPKSRKRVFEALSKLQYATNSMIANYLGWSINRVTPRTNELRKIGLIEKSHISWCPITKSKAQFLKLKGGKNEG